MVIKLRRVVIATRRQHQRSTSHDPKKVRWSGCGQSVINQKSEA
jgi:hypothetical protein